VMCLPMSAPQRTRRMKRWVFTILLFLLLGAIVNVAVAWGITTVTPWFGWPSSPGTFSRQFPWPRPVPDHWPKLAIWLHFGSFGWDLDQYQATAVEDRGDAGFWATESIRIEIVRVGWPTRSLRHEGWVDWVHPTGTGDPGYYRFDGQPEPTYWSYGIPLKFDRFGFGPRSPKRLPVHLIWTGFTVNTLFYAIILWLLYRTSSVLRRHIRLKRGRCPNCGYDLRGKHDAGCPECGWNRPSEHAADGHAV